jgi:ribose 1,5-bisphosphokinase PhnN
MQNMIKPTILAVIGASGAGKTTAVRCLEARGRSGIRCFYFDSVGVPSEEIMKRDFGGGEAWQAVTTQNWISQLTTEPIGSIRILEGQTRPTFIRAALPYSQLAIVRIVLVECAASVRRKRLAERGQEELATVQMDIWAGYLRGQADALQLPIIDTTNVSAEEVANILEVEAETLRAEAKSAAQPAAGADVARSHDHSDC